MIHVKPVVIKRLFCDKHRVCLHIFLVFGIEFFPVNCVTGTYISIATFFENEIEIILESLKNIYSLSNLIFPTVAVMIYNSDIHNITLLGGNCLQVLRFIPIPLEMCFVSSKLLYHQSLLFYNIDILILSAYIGSIVCVICYKSFFGRMTC